MSLTSCSNRYKIPFVSMEGVSELIGKVYPNGKTSWKVHFRGNWFTRDEHGRTFRAEFYAYSFLNLLNSLYDPDPAKNRYDPSRFKDKTPYHFDEAFELYLDRKETDSGWQKNKKWIYRKHLEPFFGKQDFRTIDRLQLENLGLKSSYEKFKSGKQLSRKQAMEAQCYEALA